MSRCEEVAMPFNLSHDVDSDIRLGATLRKVREYRHLSACEVARRLGMARSSYGEWERGATRLTFRRIRRFADVTDSDPMAITVSLPFNNPDFAVACADNKLVSIVVTALFNMHEQIGDDLARLRPETILAAVQKICDDVSQRLRHEERFETQWLARDFQERFGGIESKKKFSSGDEYPKYARKLS
jgi:transcriptional regulator with XRE-family HTH domain